MRTPNKNIFVMAAAFISIMLLIIARHHPPSRRKIKEIWHGRVYWESNSNTSMLRSSVRVMNTAVDTDADIADAATDTDADATVTTVNKIDIELAVIVLSARNYKERREVIRETWGNGHSNVFFVVGKHCPYKPDQRKPWVCEPKNQNMLIDLDYNSRQEILTRELNNKPDVIVVDMIDVYRNLPEKLKLGYMWILENTDAKYVLKMDDDSFARVDSVQHWLQNRENPPKNEIIAGGFSRGSPSRRGKWAETKYKPDKYPPWPSGAGHIVSRPVIKYLHQNADTWVSYQGEDTSLGIWMEKVRPQMDVKRTSSEHFITHSGDCHNKNKFVIGHSISLQKMRECYKTLDEYEHVKKAMSPENINIDSNNKIDIVIPWAGNPRVKPHIQKEQDPTRDRYNGELPYLLKSIAQNAPWVNKVWVLVNGDPSLHELIIPKTLNCEMLNRCSFMPKGSCPTRNGMVVVAFAHRIPKLAEKWIYTADEVFLGRPVKPAHFYKGNKPYVWRKKPTWGYFSGQTFHRLYKDASVVSFKTPKSSSPSPHYWFPQLKSVTVEMEKEYPEFYNFIASHTEGRYSSLAKGWSDRDNSQEEDFVGWMNWKYIETGKGVYKNIDNERGIWWDEVHISKPGFEKAVREKPIFMNVNDRFSKDPSQHKKQVKWFLNAMEKIYGTPYMMKRMQIPNSSWPRLYSPQKNIINDQLNIKVQYITGRSKIVSAPTTVFWQRDAFTDPITYEDVSGCEKNCRVVSNVKEADILISTHSPVTKVKNSQLTVHFSRESLKYNGKNIAQFDLTMDMSPLSNIPITSIPSSFWQTMHDMPIPTKDNIKKRKLAVWYGSNCDNTQWPRTKYLQELSQYMDIDFPGKCLHNTVSTKSRIQYATNPDIYKNYLFVFGFHNALDNRNIDEKMFYPFLGNSVNVVMANDIAYSFAPGKNSFVDASRFVSPKELAEYLLYLQAHPEEYLKFFEYRKETTQPKALAMIQETSIYQKGNLCRVCACVADEHCRTKRKVSQSGYEVYSSSPKKITTTTKSKDLTLTTFKWEEDSHVIIEVGLHNTVMSPKGNNHHVIGIEASLDSLVKHFTGKIKTPNLHLLNAAIYDKDGIALFNVMDAWTASNSLVYNPKNMYGKFKYSKQLLTSTLRLEHICNAIPENTAIDLIKIDVQGVNINVLRSAGDTLLRARSIFTECTRESTMAGGISNGATPGGLKFYGNVEDVCENVKDFMVNEMGFVYIGHWTESKADASGDMAFVHPNFIDYFRSIFGDSSHYPGPPGNIMKKNDGMEYKLAEIMYKKAAVSKRQNTMQMKKEIVPEKNTSVDASFDILIAPYGPDSGLSRRTFHLDDSEPLNKCNKIITRHYDTSTVSDIIATADVVWMDCVWVHKNMKALRAKLTSLNIKKPKNQRWICASTETSIYYPHLYPFTQLRQTYPEIDFFSTNRLDSDIPLIEIGNLYGVTVDKLLNVPTVSFTDKIPKVLTMYNNCNAKSGRQNYIKSFIDSYPSLVANYGTCWGGKSTNNAYTHNGVAEKLKRLGKHMFSFCIENSYVKDYVSEKIYQSLAEGSIPIYKGAPNAKDIIPCEHCVIWVDDYPTADALAKHLQYLIKNKDAYEEYFKWKKSPRMDAMQRLKDYSLDSMFCRWTNTQKVIDTQNVSGVVVSKKDKNLCFAKEFPSFLPGKWVIKEKSKTMYGRASTYKEWNTQACYAETTLQSCFFQGFSDRALRLHNREWLPDTCNLLHFDAETFVSRFSGYTIVFEGDSVIAQQFQSLLCLLAGYEIDTTGLNWRDETRKWNTKKNCPEGPQHCYFAGSDTVNCVKFKNDIKICTKDLDYRKWNTYDKKTIVLINDGLHLKNDGISGYPLLKKRSQWFKEILKARDETPASIIWVETTQQHFDSIDGSYELSKTKRCSNRKLDLSKSPRFIRDSRIMSFMEKNKFPILRINGYDNTMEAHVIFQDRHDSISGGDDCTHFCLPGLPDHWNRLLYNYLMNLPVTIIKPVNIIKPATIINLRMVGADIPSQIKSKVEKWVNTNYNIEIGDTVVPNALVHNWYDNIITNMIPDYDTNSIMVKKSKTKPSFFMAMPGYKTDYISKSIMRTGMWENVITTFFEYIMGEGNVCSPETTVVDIGANIGYFSGYLMSTGCKVISIELQARMANWNIATMMLNQKYDGQMNHYSMGLSNEKMNVEVHSAIKASWYVAEIANANSGEYYNSLRDKDRYVVERARLRKFDDMFADVDSIYFLKMDIDGHECKALDGMRKTIALRKIKHIQLEFDPFLWKESGNHDNQYGLEIANLLVDAGYHFYIIPDPRFESNFGVTDFTLPKIHGIAYKVQAIPDNKVRDWLKALPELYPRVKNANLYITTESFLPTTNKICVWAPKNNEKCSDMVQNILKSLNERRILFLGDSTMFHTYDNIPKYGKNYITTERCDWLQKFGIKKSEKWVPPHKDSGPVLYGLEHHWCTDCSGCKSFFYTDKGKSNSYIALEYAKDVEMQSELGETTQETLVNFLKSRPEYELCVVNSGLHDQAIQNLSTKNYALNVKQYLQLLGSVCSNIVWVETTAPKTNWRKQKKEKTKEWNDAVNDMIHSDLPDVYIVKVYEASLNWVARDLYRDNVHLKEEWYYELSKLFNQ